MFRCCLDWLFCTVDISLNPHKRPMASNPLFASLRGGQKKTVDWSGWDFDLTCSTSSPISTNRDVPQAQKILTKKIKKKTPPSSHLFWWFWELFRLSAKKWPTSSFVSWIVVNVPMYHFWYEHVSFKNEGSTKTPGKIWKNPPSWLGRKPQRDCGTLRNLGSTNLHALQDPNHCFFVGKLWCLFHVHMPWVDPPGGGKKFEQIRPFSKKNAGILVASLVNQLKFALERWSALQLYCYLSIGRRGEEKKKKGKTGNRVGGDGNSTKYFLIIFLGKPRSLEGKWLHSGPYFCEEVATPLSLMAITAYKNFENNELKTLKHREINIDSL